MRETDCSNIYNMSPGWRTGHIDPANPEVDSQEDMGSGLRSLPRLSSSQIVRNMKDIHTNGRNVKGKYRHVSHADFN